MTRIMVIGAPGSGKSTLGRALATRLNLPIVHLDRMFWLPGWVERPRAEQFPIAAAAEAMESWVIEGNFKATWPNRAARAHLVVWLDLPLWLRIWRILRRWARYRGQSRPDMQDGCPERLAPEFLWYVLTTWRRSRAIRQHFWPGCLRQGRAPVQPPGRRAVVGRGGAVNGPEGLPPGAVTIDDITHHGMGRAGTQLFPRTLPGEIVTPLPDGTTRILVPSPRRIAAPAAISEPAAAARCSTPTIPSLPNGRPES